jgi:hypothetical protein
MLTTMAMMLISFIDRIVLGYLKRVAVAHESIGRSEIRHLTMADDSAQGTNLCNLPFCYVRGKDSTRKYLLRPDFTASISILEACSSHACLYGQISDIIQYTYLYLFLII